MRTIRIVSGVYGHRPAGKKYVERKRASDPPFEVESKEAARLVALKVAEYADVVEDLHSRGVATGHVEENPDQVVDNSADGLDPSKNDLESDQEKDEDQEIPEYSTDMKMDELRVILDECGIPFKVGMSKEDIVDLLDEYFYGADDETDEDDEFPGFDDEDVVP